MGFICCTRFILEVIELEIILIIKKMVESSFAHLRDAYVFVTFQDQNFRSSEGLRSLKALFVASEQTDWLKNSHLP